MAIVDVVTRLTTRTVVHVENQVKSIELAPVYHLVHHTEAFASVVFAHIVLVGKELVVEWQANGVGTRLLNEGDVGSRDVVVLEGLPELTCEVGTRQLANHVVDHPLAVGLLEIEHVAFWVEPVTEVRTYYI